MAVNHQGFFSPAQTPLYYNDHKYIEQFISLKKTIP